MQYSEAYKIFLKVGKRYVSEFIVDEHNSKQIEFVIKYFLGLELPKLDSFQQFNHSKGLLFRGKTGTGKDLIFKICQKFLRKFSTNLCTDVVSEYDAAGEEGIYRFRTKERVFSDLGTENLGKHYGNQQNVIENLIYNRYNSYQNLGLLTHFTTNLTNEQLMEKYGERPYDRLKEMCNIINFNGDSFRGISNNILIKKNEMNERELTDIEKDNLMIDSFLEYAKMPTDPKYLIKHHYYNFLERKGLINLSLKEKERIYEVAEKEVTYELKQEQERLMSLGDRLRAKNIFSSSNNIKGMIVNKAKELALEEFVMEDENIEKVKKLRHE